LNLSLVKIIFYLSNSGASVKCGLVKIDVAADSFADHALHALCRRRLAGVLARYADLLTATSVGPGTGAGAGSGGAGLRVEVLFCSGARVSVEQAEVGEAGAVLHLADRVGRAVARRVDLDAVFNVNSNSNYRRGHHGDHD